MCAINSDRYVEICNILNDLSNKIYGQSKTEDFNFNMLLLSLQE